MNESNAEKQKKYIYFQKQFQILMENTLYAITEVIRKISLLQPNVRSFSEGSVYDAMNAQKTLKYSVVVATQQNHTENDYAFQFNFTLFYVDRLQQDLSNRLDIQSRGIEVLSNITRTLEEATDSEASGVRYTTFTQKFTDQCAGAYVQFQIEVMKEWKCPDTYGEIEIPEQPTYREGYVDGYRDGGQAQKEKLETVSISGNGVYIREDGWNEVTVNVEAPSPRLQDISVTENGTYVADEDYDGLGTVVVEVDAGTEIELNQEEYDPSGFGRYYFDYTSATTISSLKVNFSESEKNYFWIKPLEDTDSISFDIDEHIYGTYAAYSLDMEHWTIVPRTKGESQSINVGFVEAGQKVYWKTDFPTICRRIDWNDYPSTFNSDVDFEIGGNILSLIYEDDFENADTIPDYCFVNMFLQNSTLVNIKDLIIRAKSAGKGSFQAMFYQTNIVHSLDSIDCVSLGDDCCTSMFYSCSSLLDAPELPAMLLGGSCYGSMFYFCTNLTRTPSMLPAKYIENECYSWMFQFCTKITESPVIEINTAKGMSEMFRYCSSLSKITIKSIDVKDDGYAMSDWVDGVASEGTFYCSQYSSFPRGTSGIPEGWTIIEIDV